MNKILKPHTIIPSELYIERDADRQLAQVINDMGRPAYILVARQMGKTNLLINAKRKSIETGDIFVYVDLSNRFDDAKSCLRNIIDIIIETNEDVLDAVSVAIYTARKVRNLPPHKEHTQELRRIISIIPGKLIICLDEIDSLTLADYSDKIFAHIRSIYFERINFPEFERLSYVLSGVAEPSEIIKDRSISPFNIGQKIFLNDFSYEEFNNFIDKAKLNAPAKSLSRVYYWTNGNPRLTWDLCSEIENKIQLNEEISDSKVDEIVKLKYLSNFDTPPIDHIRSLITSNKGLRDGLKLIYENKINKISDEVKSKLYLAGILSSNYESGIIEIKNKIIAESINEAWLSSLVNSEADSLNYAQELMSNGDYKETVKVCEKLLETKELDEEDLKIVAFQLASSYFHLGKLKESKKTFYENLFDKNSYRALYLDQLNYIGLASLNLKDLDDSESCFQEIIEAKSKHYIESLINLAATYILKDHSNYSDEIKSLLAKAINEVSETAQNFKTQLSSANSLLGRIYELESDLDKSYEYYIKTYEVAETEEKVNALVAAYQVKEDDSLLDKIEFVMRNPSFRLSKSIYKSFLTFDKQSFISLVSLAVIHSDKLLDFLFEFAVSHKGEDQFNLTNLLLQAANQELSNSKSEPFLKILRKFRKLDTNQIRSADSFSVIKYLTFFSTSENQSSMRDEYFQGVMNYVQQPDVVDIHLFEKGIAELITSEQFEKALSLSNLILNLVPDPSFELKMNLVRIYFYRIHCLSEEKEVISQGKEFLEMIKPVKKEDLDSINIKFQEIKDLSERIESYVANVNALQYKVETYKRPFKKVGRNERVIVKYKNGEIIKKKYKDVEKDIAEGSCEFVE